MSRLNMKKNIVLMILNQGFPDVRVCQEADALKSAGYSVYIVIDKDAESPSPNYLIEDYQVIPLEVCKSKRERITMKFSFNNNSLYKRLMANSIFKNIKDSIVAVHIHDLLWADFGFKVADKLGVKKIIDFHENYPALMASILENRTGIKNYIFDKLKSHTRYIKYEEKVVAKADGIIVVAEENLERISERFPQELCLTVVSNTKDPDSYRYMGIKPTERIHIVYHGTIQELRGLRTVVRAIADLDPEDFKLTILGFKDNCAEKEALLKIIEYYSLSNVELINWTSDFSKIEEVIKKADLCVIPHDRTELTETTLPNKIFEYFCYGKPVLVSDVKPLARIVKKTNSGIVFKSQDYKDLVMKLKELDKGELLIYAKNARCAAENDFCWESDKKRLINLYEKALTKP